MSLLAETRARILLLVLIGGLVLSLSLARWIDRRGAIEIHAAMPERGGWSPDQLKVQVGRPLKLRLISDDVLHGFAIGQSDRPAVELKPGLPVETTLIFTQPGKYVYYCTHWCGPNHWRMRGVIDVVGTGPEKPTQDAPLYSELGLDVDKAHLAAVVPVLIPSSQRGTAFIDHVSAVYRSLVYYQTHSPAEAWLALRAESSLARLDDQQVWDLVAYIWKSNATSAGLVQGERLYAANCAACHGETGAAGDGVFATSFAADLKPDSPHTLPGQHAVQQVDFTDPENMLGASPAILEGKIERGGMGTGMPYWGPIFTREQLWNIVSYLWNFQFDWR